MSRGVLNLRWIDPAAPPDEFPDPHDALAEPNGLLAIGGDLSVERLLAAYERGIFPWYSDDQPILWWTPNPRAVLFPSELRISRSLGKTMRKNVFDLSIDRAFDAVVAGCADRGIFPVNDRSEPGTWITADMAAAYGKLHAAGYAHSIETWRDGLLVGGLYGVNIGRVFFGESMFCRVSDASKIALVKLAAHCRAVGIELIDCQVPSGHLASLGSREIPRDEFNRLLVRLTAFKAPADWPNDIVDSVSLFD